MQTTQSNDARGVVQWVNPNPIKPKKDAKSSRNTINNRNNRSPLNSSSYESKENFNNHSNRTNESYTSFANENYKNIDALNSSDTDCDSNTSSIDTATCKTICVIVEEYLKDLREHQRSINSARSDLDEAKLICREDYINHISQNDITKLKVRDEQTKAIETIKQLIIYLRELSLLNHQTLCDIPDCPLDDEIVHRLSDVRVNVVQALNDFVLMNSDIDMPIGDVDGYDLCLDAGESTSSAVSINHNKNKPKPDYSINSAPSSMIIVDLKDSTNYQRQTLLAPRDMNTRFTILENRKREIQKLEKDTVELRKLFSDFYSLVRIQSEQMDTIEDSIVIATQKISEGQNNINKKVRTLTVLVPFTGCMAGALIGGPLGFVLGGKLGGVSVVCASSLLGLVSSYGAGKCILSKKIKRD